MSLHVVIGFDGPLSDAKPSIVYLGRDGTEAMAAIKATKVFRYEMFRNPLGVRKANPNYRATEPVKPEPVKPEPVRQSRSFRN